MTPHEALTRAIADLAQDGTRPPCSTTPERWIGESAGARADAAAECVNECPLIHLCRVAGLTETWGVWGGIDRARRQKKTPDAPTLFDLERTPA